MAEFGPLVSGRWLAAHQGEVHIVDVRWYPDGRSGRAAYQAGHIPGAVWLDIDTDLSAPAGVAGGRHPLPAPERFAAALGRVGIGEAEPVVAYDDAGGSTAARLWWLLHVLGEPVAVLDGAIASWPGRLSTDVPAVSPVTRLARPWPADRFTDADALAATHATVLDARTAERYAHGEPALDPRPGHIPGARSAPWAANLDATTGRFLDAAALREHYAALGAAAAAGGVVAYCGSGVTACHDLLALQIAGVTDTVLYPGSWSQWAADPARAVQTS